MPATPAELTIEKLAAASGMSVRNIRAHQARGLLDPPQVRLRVGYYGPGHIAQLRLIRELQADGFNLAGIKALLNDAQGSGERLGRVREALAAGPETETPVTLGRAELIQRFAIAPGDAEAVLARAERLGVLVPAGPDRFLAPSPRLLDIAERVVARGVSLDGALEALEQTERHCEAIAQTFVRLFYEQVWRPYEAAGMPEARWREVDGSIAALRPLAGEALQTIFGRRMRAQLDAAVGALTRRLGDQ